MNPLTVPTPSRKLAPLVAALFCLAAQPCLAADDADAPKGPAVTVLTAQKACFAAIVEVTGPVIARDETAVRPERQGLKVAEILADAGVFYDYESKYADGGSRHIVPAAVHPDIYARALDVAAAAHRALGCRGATRCDFRYDDTAGEPGRLVLLEINTQPGLTPTSLLPEQAAHLGMSFPRLCAWMVENAACRV